MIQQGTRPVSSHLRRDFTSIMTKTVTKWTFSKSVTPKMYVRSSACFSPSQPLTSLPKNPHLFTPRAGKFSGHVVSVNHGAVLFPAAVLMSAAVAMGLLEFCPQNAFYFVYVLTDSVQRLQKYCTPAQEGRADIAILGRHRFYLVQGCITTNHKMASSQP